MLIISEIKTVSYNIVITIIMVISSISPDIKLLRLIFNNMYQNVLLE